MTSNLPTQRKLTDMFSYDAVSGLIYWKYRPEQRNSWNKRWAGKEAGTLDRDGYVIVRMTVDGVKIVTRKHRLVYKMLTGEEPEIVDHRFGLSAGDTVINLRSATKSQNGCNRRANKGRSLPKNVYATGKTFVVKLEFLGRVHQKGGFSGVAAAETYAILLANELHGAFSASLGVAQDEQTR